LTEANIRENFRILAINMRVWAINVRLRKGIVKTLWLKQKSMNGPSNETDEAE
jgi:hypothetical protein